VALDSKEVTTYEECIRSGTGASLRGYYLTTLFKGKCSDRNSGAGRIRGVLFGAIFDGVEFEERIVIEPPDEFAVNNAAAAAAMRTEFARLKRALNSTD